MEKYDYRSEMTKAIKEAMKEHYADCANADIQTVYDDLWADDTVTGNGSGSYFCNRWKAEEAICHNWDLLEEAVTELGYKDNLLEKGAEFADVTIRCYLLSECIEAAIQEFQEERQASIEHAKIEIKMALDNYCENDCEVEIYEGLLTHVRIKGNVVAEAVRDIIEIIHNELDEDITMIEPELGVLHFY